MELELIVGASTEEQNQFCRDMATRQAKLEELRSTGVNKIESLKNENFKVKKNKELSKEEKDGIIEANKTLIEEARQDSLNHKEEISTLEKEARQQHTGLLILANFIIVTCVLIILSMNGII